ncbi:MAG TPA: metallopeptidase family protein [Candidatus Limnocylindria bacterium]|nr:metallopeptidase family protein [Candidatus Limnocylindria bacterium]
MPIRRRGSQARRHPARRAPGVPALPHEQHRPFEDLVGDALDALPDDLTRLLENVAIVIDDEPSAEQRQENGLADGDSLYGLYEGVSGITYGADFASLPNKITLFRLPLEEDFADPRDLAREVQRTVVHELAHHAGISDEALRRRGF